MNKAHTTWIALALTAALAQANAEPSAAHPTESHLLVVHHESNTKLAPLESELTIELQVVLDATEVSLHTAPSLWYTADSLSVTDRLFEMLSICQEQGAGAMIELVSRGESVEQFRIVVVLPSGAIGRTMKLPNPVDRADVLALIASGLLDEAILFDEYRRERGAEDPGASEQSQWTNLVALTPQPEPTPGIAAADRVSMMALGAMSLPASDKTGSAAWFGGELVIRVAIAGNLHGVIDLALQGGRLETTIDTLDLSGWRLWPGIGLDYDWRWKRFGLELYALGVFPWTLLELSGQPGPSSTTTFWGFRLDGGVGGRWFIHERLGLALRTAIGVNAFRDTLESTTDGEAVFQNPLLEWSTTLGFEYYLL